MQNNNSSDNVRSEIMRLVQPGVLGFYSHFKVTEIIGFPSKGSSPINIFTLVVAEDREEAPQQEAKPLNSSRITVKSLREWCFGVYRYGRAIEDLGPAIDDLRDRKQWSLSGTPLVLGPISLAPRQFVPPDSVSSVPWNNLLKNNFWGGSHVFEWSDPEKALLRPLFDEPRRLQELSEAVQAVVPIKIASLSDRIGNVVLQLPATLLMAKFARRQDENEWVVQIGWHPKATPRPLRATCEMEFDSVVSGYVSCDITDASTSFSMPAKHGLHRGIVWDEGNKVVLAATGPSAFINTVGLNMYIGDPEPRVFLRADPDGTMRQQRVSFMPRKKVRLANHQQTSMAAGHAGACIRMKRRGSPPSAALFNISQSPANKIKSMRERLPTCACC